MPIIIEIIVIKFKNNITNYRSFKKHVPQSENSFLNNDMSNYPVNNALVLSEMTDTSWFLPIH